MSTSRIPLDREVVIAALTAEKTTVVHPDDNLALKGAGRTDGRLATLGQTVHECDSENEAETKKHEAFVMELADGEEPVDQRCAEGKNPEVVVQDEAEDQKGSSSDQQSCLHTGLDEGC